MSVLIKTRSWWLVNSTEVETIIINRLISFRYVLKTHWLSKCSQRALCYNLCEIRSMHTMPHMRRSGIAGHARGDTETVTASVRSQWPSFNAAPNIHGWIHRNTQLCVTCKLSIKRTLRSPVYFIRERIGVNSTSPFCSRWWRRPKLKLFMAVHFKIKA